MKTGRDCKRCAEPVGRAMWMRVVCLACETRERAEEKPRAVIAPGGRITLRPRAQLSHEEVA